MLRITKISTDLPPSVRLGDNTVFEQSWCELADEGTSFKSGRGTRFVGAQITIKPGGTLTIGDGCEIRGRIIVESCAHLKIGHGLVCNAQIKIHVAEAGTISIGNECLFADAVIYNSDMHSLFDVATGDRINIARDVCISDRVWLASSSIVLKGTELSPDTAVGACAVVSGKFPPNVVIAGNPARIVREGVSWSRHLLESKPLQFEDGFSPSSLKVAAAAYKHDEVINMALPHFDRWTAMDTSNAFIFYYLARAIFEVGFTGRKGTVIELEGREFSLTALRDIFLKVWELTAQRNYPCGSYAYLLNAIVGDHNAATQIYDTIFSVWPQINQFRKRLPILDRHV